MGATAGLVMFFGAAAPAGADPIGDCTTTTGVIVAVDFTHWNGTIERGCDATLTTGYQALHAAGFTTAGDIQDGPGFICRIDNEPSPAEEPCTVTPPADASWSYWHADAGQDTWTYSQLGAMDYHPPAGSVDAWTFGSTDIGTDGQPTFAPSSVRATNSSGSSTTTTAVTTSTAPTGTAPTSTAPPGAPGPSTSGTGGAPQNADRPSSSPATGPSGGGGGQGGVSATTVPAPTTATTAAGAEQALAGGRRSTPKIVDVAPAAADRQAGGSPVAALVGAGVVVVLAGAAGVVAWRRRRIS